ncbi:MAG TPA: hypothetical protein VHH92_00155, partial [Actinomycetota bacterium]|nr:hypothetical protein [Actinomycetota bacterium]
RVREQTRLRAATPVPDLVPEIMRRVATEAPVGLRSPRRTWAGMAAAFAAGVVAAAVAVAGLPGVRRGPSPALAEAIPDRIADASAEVAGYRATFRIVERGFHRRVSRRVFIAHVAFRAPERFRVDIEDRTTYPAPGWPRNDVTLAVDGARWGLDAPRGCPREALPSCAPVGRDVIRVVGRPPFEDDAPLPTDIVLPVRTLAGSGRVAVRGSGEVLGRDAVVVELAYRDAAPLFGFLHAGGVWRPIFPHDRVLVSLDEATWFPLAFEVVASSSPEREAWSIANAVPAERPGALVLGANVIRFGSPPEPGWVPDVPGGPTATRDLGFREAPPGALDAPAPTELLGLRPFRTGTLPGPAGSGSLAIRSYARGLSWLTVTATRGWDGPSLFGDLGDLAEPVRAGEGTVYYEPASGTAARRVAVHERGWDVELESNLPRSELLAIAASLPVTGQPVPKAWLDRVPARAALNGAPFVLMPTRLPADYRPWGARLTADGAVTVWFRRPGVEPGPGIVLHQARGAALPPPLEGEVLAVTVRGSPGRYSPARGELEWVEDGVYRSLGGGALDLTGLLRVASSLERPA